jgi:hypothetical protein
LLAAQSGAAIVEMASMVSGNAFPATNAQARPAMMVI